MKVILTTARQSSCYWKQMKANEIRLPQEVVYDRGGKGVKSKEDMLGKNIDSREAEER